MNTLKAALLMGSALIAFFMERTAMPNGQPIKTLPCWICDPVGYAKDFNKALKFYEQNQSFPKEYKLIWSRCEAHKKSGAKNV